MYDASPKTWEKGARWVRIPILAGLLFVFLIAFAPVLAGHSASLAGETADIAVTDTYQATNGPGDAHPDMAGLSCSPVGGCSVVAMLPDACQVHPLGDRQMHLRVESVVWTTRQIAPDVKPPIA